jgi:uridylate kinase
MKKILIKISGELFNQHDGSQREHTCVDKTFVYSLIQQIKTLAKDHQIGIVIGGGNFFRGCKEGNQLSLRPTTADSIGMLATIMNGLILQDFLQEAGIKTALLSAVDIPIIARPIRQSIIDEALDANRCLIFAGGTGNPFFTTDTTAVLRALQMGAQEVWKATKVDYVYDGNPSIDPAAKPIHKLTYQSALDQKLHIMDLTALTLAQEHKLRMRVFNLFADNALINVAQDPDFGSTIC